MLGLDNFLPTGFSIKPPKVKLLAGEQKATEYLYSRSPAIFENSCLQAGLLGDLLQRKGITGYVYNNDQTNLFVRPFSDTNFLLFVPQVSG